MEHEGAPVQWNAVSVRHQWESLGTEWHSGMAFDSWNLHLGIRCQCKKLGQNFLNWGGVHSRKVVEYTHGYWYCLWFIPGLVSLLIEIIKCHLGVKDWLSLCPAVPVTGPSCVSNSPSGLAQWRGVGGMMKEEYRMSAANKPRAKWWWRRRGERLMGW